MGEPGRRDRLEVFGDGLGRGDRFAGHAA
jgi:hypothetical protein